MAKKVIKIEPIRQQVIHTLRPQKRVCAYCRVSTDSTKQHTSYVAQMEYYEQYIRKREDWSFAGIFADEAKSGTKVKNRDEFQRMMKDCERGNIDIIVTKSITRFARNTVDSIEAIRKLKALGVTVYFEKEKLNTLSEQSEQMLTILSSLAQGESESISTNNRWAIQKRFRDGSYRMCRVAYGYTKDEDGELIINDEEAMIVQRIFKEYLHGIGVYNIAKNLTHEKIPTPRLAKAWSDHVISEILKNPIYVGDLMFQKTYTTEVLPYTKKMNRGEKPQFYIKDNHEAIVSREEAELVKEILAYKRQKEGLDYKDKCQNRYELSGKIRCSECGSTFRRQKIYIGRPYEKVQWGCSLHLKDHKACTMKSIRDDVIKAAYLSLWNKLVCNYEDILIPMRDSLKNLRINQQQEQEIINLNQKIMELTEQSHILSRVVQKGYMDSALFIQKQNVLNIELEETKKQRNGIMDNNGFEKELEGTQRLLEIIRLNPELMEAYDENLFTHTVQQVIIGHQGDITFRLINNLELTEYIGNRLSGGGK